MKNFKKKLLLFFVFSFVSMPLLMAQSEFIQGLTDLRDNWIRPAYPILAGLVLIVGVIMNFGKLFGENRDVKAAITNIFVYLAVVLAVVGVYEAISAVTI